MTVLLDTHIVQWWSAEPEKLSAAATEAITAADELAVAASPGTSWPGSPPTNGSPCRSRFPRGSTC